MGYILAGLILAAVAVPGVARADETKYTTRLIQAIDSTEKTAVPVWVRFVDKGMTATETALALEAFEAELPVDLLKRRAKRTPGTNAVDEADLPLDPGYLEAVAATGALGRKQSRWLNAASFDATSSQIKAIAQLPFVTVIDLVAGGTGSKPRISEEIPAEVEAFMAAAGSDKSLQPLAYGFSLPGLDQINATGAHAMGLSGRGVTIAILDTGFELEHECFRNLDVVATWDFINDHEYVGPRKKEDLYQTYYGTASLSAVAGYSPDNLIGSAYGASVILAKTEDLADETPIEEDNWIAALEWAVSLGADVVSSSLGYYSWYDFSDLDGSTALITVAAELAAARGVCVVNSAGNQRGNPEWNHIIPPSDGRSVLSVGSADLNGQISVTSSPGPTADGRIKPDFLALGEGVAVASSFYPDMYFFGNGSNFATPLVSGVVALMLEQNPHLSPIQVMEALHASGNRAQLPDNDFGWGIIDAVAAMNYWAPAIEHTPLVDTEGGTGAYRITATITGPQALDEARTWVAWRLEGQAWHVEPLVADGSDVYTGFIPPQPRNGSDVEYYIVATDSSGAATRDPALAPENVYTFRVGADTTPPVLEHINIPDQVQANWPPTLIAYASDNLEMDSVELLFNPNPGLNPGPHFMAKVGDHYELPFPIDPLYAVPGLNISYMLIARDKAAIPNLTISGSHNFSTVYSKGNVLVVDDRANTKSEASGGRGDLSKGTEQDKSAVDIATMIADAGFDVAVLPAGQVTSSSFHGHDAVIVTCGGNFSPLSSNELRRTMVAWVENGGRIVVEGGEVGYAAAIGNDEIGYPEVKSKVLHIDNYAGEDGALLRVPSPMINHPLLNRPHRISGPLEIFNNNGNDWSAADLVQTASDAFVAMQSGYGSSRGGVIVHDDNTCPDAGQTVYLPFDLLKTPDADGRALIDNIFTYLLYNEPPGTGSISGTVILAGMNDHSGVTIKHGTNQSTVTAADGSFHLTGLWGGDYRITAEIENFSSQTRSLAVIDDAETPGVEFYLLPVTEVQYSASPGLPIPDNNPAGVEHVIQVSEVGNILGITIDTDISHFAIGHLVITLTSPEGTSVTLHNRTGGTADNLVGNWPKTLFIDGPGSLADFKEESPLGSWTFKVVDAQLGALGTLNSWGLNLLVTDHGASPVESSGLPQRTRLVGNAPNPFNPKTVISFELARSGPVRLEIYDVKGRLVKKLDDRVFPAGRHSVPWNGRDTRGADTASGLYFFRLRTEDEVQTHKMLLVR